MFSSIDGDMRESLWVLVDTILLLLFSLLIVGGFIRTVIFKTRIKQIKPKQQVKVLSDLALLLFWFVQIIIKESICTVSYNKRDYICVAWRGLGLPWRAVLPCFFSFLCDVACGGGVYYENGMI